MSAYAFAFDVDGVLLHGDVPQKGAREVIQHMQDNGVPHVFMTNGGGTTEKVKAETMGKKLGVEIDESQVILGHTPMRDLAQHRNDHVLVVGKNYERLIPIMENYGFTDITTTEQYHARDPLAYTDLPAEPCEQVRITPTHRKPRSLSHA
jgi:HAD superfamily hydrolase (TIGR01450 family)